MIDKISEKLREIDEEHPWLFAPFRHDRAEAFVLGIAVGFLLFAGFAFRPFEFRGAVRENYIMGEIDVEGVPENISGEVYIDGWINHFDIGSRGTGPPPPENIPIKPIMEVKIENAGRKRGK